MQDQERGRRLPPWTNAERASIADLVHSHADAILDGIQRGADVSADALWARVGEEIAGCGASMAVAAGSPAYAGRDAAARALLAERFASVADEVIDWVRLADRGDSRTFYAVLHELIVACLTYRVAYPVRQGMRFDGTLDAAPFVIEVEWITHENGPGAFEARVPDEDPAAVQRSRRAYLIAAIDEEDAHLKRLTSAQRADLERIARVPNAALEDAHTDELETILETVTDSYRLFGTDAGRASLLGFLRTAARKAAQTVLRAVPEHPDAALFREVIAMPDADLTPKVCNRVHRLRMAAAL